MRATLLGLVGLMVVGSGCAMKQQTQPTRVVVVLEGKRVKVDPVADQLTAVIGEQFTLVSDTSYRKVAKALDARRVSKRNVARVAERIDADAVIVGQLDKRSKKRYRLYLQLRDGSTGALKKSWSITLRTPELGEGQQAQIDSILARIQMIERRAPVVEEDEEEAEEVVAKAEPPARKSQAKPEKKAKPVAKAEKVAKAEPKKDATKKKPKKPVVEEEEEEEPFVMDIRTDEKGQVLDDERPPGM